MLAASYQQPNNNPNEPPSQSTSAPPPPDTPQPPPDQLISQPAPARKKRKTPPSSDQQPQQPPPPPQPTPQQLQQQPPIVQHILPPPHTMVYGAHQHVPHPHAQHHAQLPPGYPAYDYSPGGLPPMPMHHEHQSASPPGGGRTLSSSKRAEQNRKAQRAFRERRDQHVKALESRSQLLDTALASADEANRRWEECRVLVDQLRVENAALRTTLSSLSQLQQHQHQQQQQEDEHKDNDMAHITEQPPAKKARGNSPAATAYLVAYNTLSALAWGHILYKLTLHLPSAPLPASAPTALADVLPVLAPYLRALPALPQSVLPYVQRAGTAFAAVGAETKWVQTAAVLEIAHAALGLVRSPVATTGAQVFSRLALVWGIADQFASARANPLYASMVLAWSVTEVIRYAFYALSLLGTPPYPLLWLRYTTFYALYPVGAGSEAFVTLGTLPAFGKGEGWGASEWVRAGMFVLWWPALYVLYSYMLGQRRKVLGGKGKRAAEKKRQ
ncbi:hypothetical protein HWV62_5550 [Athelia sp. TMB]|nr:hypothetical protein HWV62_5550 [Athelia sp. TMB]